MRWQIEVSVSGVDGWMVFMRGFPSFDAAADEARSCVPASVTWRVQGQP